MHSVRFDVYTRTDKGEIIDFEMQILFAGSLMKRKGISCYDYVQ